MAKITRSFSVIKTEALKDGNPIYMTFVGSKAKLSTIKKAYAEHGISMSDVKLTMGVAKYSIDEELFLETATLEEE